MGQPENYLAIITSTEHWNNNTQYSHEWNGFSNRDASHMGYICEWDSEEAYNAYLNRSNTTVSEGHVYKTIQESMTWTEARDYCQSLGGHLATISNEAEQETITQLLEDCPNRLNCYWIGLQKTGSDWTWIDETDFDYTNWAYNEPNNMNSDEPYVHVFGNAWTGGTGVKNVGEWNDASDEGAEYFHAFYALSHFGFICEWDNEESYAAYQSRDAH